MAKFEKTNYLISINDDGNGNCKAEEVSGYEFTVVINGCAHRFATHRNENGNWELTDVLSGLMTAPCKYGTRKEVYEYATSTEYVEKLGEYLEKWPHTYAANIEVFNKIIEGEKMTVRQRHDFIEKRALELTKAAQEREKKSEPKPKKTTSKVKVPKAPKAAAVPEPKPAPKATPKPEVATTATTATVEITEEFMKEWASKRELLAKKKSASAKQIFVYGIGYADFDLRSEIKELGGKWSKNHKAWWVKLTA